MKLETYIVYLESSAREYSEVVSGAIFGSIEELKDQFANDGVDIKHIEPLYEFQEEWNNTDDDTDGLREYLETTMITYIYVVKP